MVRKILIFMVIAIACLSGNLFNIAKQNVVYSNSLNEKSDLQEYKFSEEDLKTFELIKGFYDDFEYSDKYTVTSENEKKMLFPEDDILLFGIYIYYEVIYDGIGIVKYSFSAGKAHSGYGSYFIIDDNTVIRIEVTMGTSGYSYEISKNGVTIDSETKEYDPWWKQIN